VLEAVDRLMDGLTRVSVIFGSSFSLFSTRLVTTIRGHE
jgi:hypothetical protein